MGAAEADRTLFVGNLDPRATEEILFELFLQAGPAISVKIPKDKDGKSKQFAFVNFKHEESVPYGMSLLNGIKLFGRPLKIQFRSGSTHSSQDANSTAYSPQGNGSFAGNSPSTHGNRHDNGEYMKYSEMSPSVPNYQRSYSSPDSLQRQAVMNNYYRPETPHGSSSPTMAQPNSSPSNYPAYQNWQRHGSNHSTPQPYESSSSHRKSRSHATLPYPKEGHHSSRDTYYRGGHEEPYYSGDGWSQNQRKEARWHSSRH